MATKRVDYDKLTAFVHKVLVGLGYNDEQAEITSWTLVEADARGVASHGVGRLTFYENNIKGGFADPKNGMPEIVHETPMSLVVDGHHGIGSHVSKFTVERMIKKAKEVGAAFASVRNSNHYGMAGMWAEKCAAEDMMGMSFTNTRICSIPTFGKGRILGTNPVCWAIPTTGDVPFMLDMATTTVAHGKIEVYERRDLDMPLGWVTDENGVGTTDTKAFQKLFWSKLPFGGHLFLGGEGEESGGHKGFGLGLLVDLLCAGMSMGRWSNDTFSGEGSGITHFFGAISLDLFGDKAEIKKHVTSILDQVRGSALADGQSRIYIHGEKEAEARAVSLKEGVEVDDALQKLLGKLGERFNIPSLF
jgi:LDH2 family malate/lactate/ureidoglycolate dehydrogenase